MRRIIIGILIVIVSVAAGFFLTSEQSGPAENGQNSGADETAEAKEFTISGGNYYFTIDEIRVKKGDKVRITFSSEDGFHDLVLDEFNVATKRFRPGEGEETVEFVADQTGEFEYYCSVGDHRSRGQVGKLIVEE